jgi:ABC-type branched-subunit amino acid transport system ATPase component
VLEIADLHTYYGESHVLQGVSLAVGPGEVVTILGRNGMGKTTLIRSIIGFTPPRRGTVRFKGADITRWPPFRTVERGMGLVPQGRRVFPSLTVRENLEVARRNAPRTGQAPAPPLQSQPARTWDRPPTAEPAPAPPLQSQPDRTWIRPPTAEPAPAPPLQSQPDRTWIRPPTAEPAPAPPLQWTLERVYELFPRLSERARNRANKLSGGEQQMLAIGRALMTNPDLLLMDEPTEGLAPILVREVGRAIGELKREGLSILLVEQNLPLALSVADRVHILSRGQIVHTCTPAELSAADAIKSRYLGV